MKKMHGQPRYSVSRPPKNGIVRPRHTAVVYIPALFRSPGGRLTGYNACSEDHGAPNPWRTLTAMSRFVVGTIVITKDERVKTAMPYRRIRFLP